MQARNTHNTRKRKRQSASALQQQEARKFIKEDEKRKLLKQSEDHSLEIQLASLRQDTARLAKENTELADENRDLRFDLGEAQAEIRRLQAILENQEREKRSDDLLGLLFEDQLAEKQETIDEQQGDIWRLGQINSEQLEQTEKQKEEIASKDILIAKQKEEIGNLQKANEVRNHRILHLKKMINKDQTSASIAPAIPYSVINIINSPGVGFYSSTVVRPQQKKNVAEEKQNTSSNPNQRKIVDY